MMKARQQAAEYVRAVGMGVIGGVALANVNLSGYTLSSEQVLGIGLAVWGVGVIGNQWLKWKNS